jgi:protein-S-isoprenylcysteine O-methyltransferase
MDMKIFNLIIAGLWLIFLLYWGISAFGVKRDIKKDSSPVRFLGVFLVILILLLSQFPFFRFNFIPKTFTVGVIAVILCALGIALALWARYYLGKNWSALPSIKEGHELVTSGPYRYVRHPIYTGIIVAMLGPMLTSSSIWFIIFFGMCFTFVWRIRKEEQFMTELFGEKYLEYKKRTKALIPFVW